MKNTSDGLISKLDTYKESFGKLENRSVEIAKIEMQREKQNEKEENIQELWENYKGFNIYVVMLTLCINFTWPWGARYFIKH